MKKGLTTTHKRVILILSGLLIFILSFFLIFQKNMDQVSVLERDNAKLQNQISFLNNLQVQVNEMKKTSDQKLQEIETYSQEFPCKMTQQKVISSLYRLWTDSGMELRAIKPGSEQTFFKDGKFITLEENDENTDSNSTETQDTQQSEAEKNPEKKVSFDKMVGKITSYEVEVSGTRKQILKAFDWISENPEHMSLSGISLSFDTSTGKLTGTLKVNFYSLNGNGVPYEDPDISSIILGNKDVFGTFKK